MEHFRINDKVRMEMAKVNMAQVIFDTINRDREYLKEWLPFVNFTFEVSDTEKFLQSVTSKHNNKDEIYCIWYNEEFAGLIGFKDTDWVNRKTEIGYWLAQNMQHKGIITNCVKRLIEYAFDKLKMNRIQIKVAEKNARSEAIPLSLNFTYEGTERSGELHGEKSLNLKIYSMLVSDRV